jgi:hypothetical protein
VYSQALVEVLGLRLRCAPQWMGAGHEEKARGKAPHAAHHVIDDPVHDNGPSNGSSII